MLQDGSVQQISLQLKMKEQYLWKKHSHKVNDLQSRLEFKKANQAIMQITQRL